MRNVRSMEQVLEIITVIGTPSKGDIQVCCPRVKKHARQCLAQCSRHPSAAVRTYTRGRAQTYFTGFGPFRANKCVPQRPWSLASTSSALHNQPLWTPPLW